MGYSYKSDIGEEEYPRGYREYDHDLMMKVEVVFKDEDGDEDKDVIKVPVTYTTPYRMEDPSDEEDDILLQHGDYIRDAVHDDYEPEEVISYRVIDIDWN